MDIDIINDLLNIFNKQTKLIEGMATSGNSGLVKKNIIPASNSTLVEDGDSDVITTKQKARLEKAASIFADAVASKTKKDNVSLEPQRTPEKVTPTISLEKTPAKTETKEIKISLEKEPESLKQQRETGPFSNITSLLKSSFSILKTPKEDVGEKRLTAEGKSRQKEIADILIDTYFEKLKSRTEDTREKASIKSLGQRGFSGGAGMGMEGGAGEGTEDAEKAKSTGSGLITALAAQFLAPRIKSVLGGLKQSLKTGVSKLVTTAKNALKTGASKVSSFTKTGLSKLSSFASSMKKMLADTTSKLASSAKTALAKITSGGSSAVKQGASKLASATPSFVKQGASKIGSVASSFFGGIKSFGTGAASMVSKGATAVGDVAVKGAKAVSSFAVEPAKKTLSTGLGNVVKSAGGAGKLLGSVGRKIPIIGPAITALMTGMEIKQLKEAQARGEITLDELHQKAGTTTIQGITGLIGSAAGGALGGAIGSLVPGAGTIIGGILGSIGGDMAGKFFGQLLVDNLISPKYTKSIGEYVAGTQSNASEMQDFIMENGKVRPFSQSDSIMGFKSGGPIDNLFKANPMDIVKTLSNPIGSLGSVILDKISSLKSNLGSQKNPSLDKLLMANEKTNQILQIIANNTAIMAQKIQSGSSGSQAPTIINSPTMPPVGGTQSQTIGLPSNRDGFLYSAYSLG